VSRRVAFVSDAVDFAGAERYAEVLFEALRGECTFVAVLGDGAPAETRDRLEAAGAEIEVVPGLRRRPTARAVYELARTLRRVRPTVVHVNATDQGDALGPLLAARLHPAPCVATLHLVVDRRGSGRERVSALALRAPDAVIAVSASVGDYLRRRGIHAVVVRNGLPATAPVDHPRAALGVGEGAVVGGLGRLDRQKGWDVLCRAAERVRAELPATEFVVVGRGPELERLERCAHVRFAGYLQPGPALLGGLDVLVVPSRYEGFGLVAVEGMQAGVPVVASEVGGLPEVVGDCALLVPPEDDAALAGAILRLLGEPALRADLARRGRERAERLFGAERMARETLAVYDELRG